MNSPSTSTAPPMNVFHSPLSRSFTQSIDLTLEDDSDSDDGGRQRKRFRSEGMEDSASASRASTPSTSTSFTSPTMYNATLAALRPASMTIPAHQPGHYREHTNYDPRFPQFKPSSQAYRPPFAGPSNASAFFPHRQLPPLTPPVALSSPTPLPPHTHASKTRQQIIDLTNSPSPPPQPPKQAQPSSASNLPDDLSPRTPICIGMLSVTALVLYPIPYLGNVVGQSQESEWASVRLQHEFAVRKPGGVGGEQTIHIRTPQEKIPNGEIIGGETFGVVEQKVASVLGPMLGKGLIKFEAKVRRGMPHLPILPLKMLVYTPKGNIPIVAGYLRQGGLLLDHPSPPFDLQHLQFSTSFYHNPHNPPPGGHARSLLGNGTRLGYLAPAGGRWSTPAVSGKSVEVHRSQVDEVFKSLRSGDDLEETEPTSDVATTLYPHQKKALTFLLEREREKTRPDGKFSSLWQARTNPLTRQTSWIHAVTQREVFHEPVDCKGALLADDMGLGKTITCVSLIAATLQSARTFAAEPLRVVKPPLEHSQSESSLSASHFVGSVWGMPDISNGSCSMGKGKTKEASKAYDKAMADYTRAVRIKARSRATLIVCPLSTVVNWEDQFREHWAGEVTVVGGGGGSMCSLTHAVATQAQVQVQPLPLKSDSQIKTEVKRSSALSTRRGTPFRVYVYHGNARRPDPTFLADFDAVITTYSTLATEYSKQSKSTQANEPDDDDDDGSSDGLMEVDMYGNQVIKLAASKKTGGKRKKGVLFSGGVEATSPLQSVHWFRVVLDEAHSIKETNTVGSRASCDLMADRRLCLTGTPVQNKLDDVFALIKFIRLDPFEDKSVWTEFIGTPVKFGQPLGVARLQTIMKCITLRRTKETKAPNGKNILALPPRRDELRYLKFEPQEQAIYDQFFNESKAEFNEMSNKNEVMKNYVGILQKILRLRQICDHFELVEGKGVLSNALDANMNYDDVVAAISRDGLTPSRAAVVFALLRESGTTQCVDCGAELCTTLDVKEAEGMSSEFDGASTSKRGGKKGKGLGSRGPTRPSSPAGPRPVLTRCQHLFCIECYRNGICPGWPNVPEDVRRSCTACQTALGPSDAVAVNPDSNTLDQPKKKPVKREKRQKGASLCNFHPSTKVKALLGDLVHFSRCNPYSANYDPGSIEVQMVDEDGNDVDDGVVKTVVFSQWTSMLDKVEDALEAAGIRYDRLDGTMKRDERTRAMEALKHDPGCEVLLVSLKAGGVGLNLTAAQRVYLMDPYWNPAVENQAVDRIHRLGQTRPVTTIKLIIENTIEARLLEVQKKKTELANMTLGQNFSKAEMLQRRMEELNQLFGA